MTDNGELVYMNPNINSCYLVSTGTEEINANEIEIYPNPVKDKLILKIPDVKKINSITIFDLKGQKIRDLEYSKEIELTRIPAGIYLLKLTFENGELIKKIIIQ